MVQAGDIFFNVFYPFIDAAHGGSLKGTIDATETILALTDSQSRIIPGHGPPGDRADLVKYRDMLKTAYTRLLALKNSGKSAQQAIAQKPLADPEASWGGGIFEGDKWIEIVYPSIY